LIIVSDKFLDYCSWFFKVDGITLWPFIVIREQYEDNRVDINHEKIHIRQQTELLVLGFYIFYILNWIFNMIRYRNTVTAYRELIFEREAYTMQGSLLYLNNRKLWAWRKYFGK